MIRITSLERIAQAIGADPVAGFAIGSDAEKHASHG